MKAVTYTQFGPPEVLRITEAEKPSPKPNEILIRVRATSVGYGDVLARDFKNLPLSEFNMPLPLYLPSRLYFGISSPKVNILGAELAGEVEAVGSEVSRFKVGDKVFGYLGQRMGAYGEYVCMAEDGCAARMPANLSYAEAAVIPYGAITALSLLRKADIQPGQKVLILGASGGIGSAAVQLARNVFGAKVTGVCSGPRAALVKRLGAEAVIDYTQEDFTENGQTYDLIFDVLGRSSFAGCKKSLSENGVYLPASFKLKELFQMLWTKLRGGKRVICALSAEKSEDLDFIRELAEAGKLKAALDRSFPIEQAAEAHRYYESGRKLGNIALMGG